MQDENDSLTGIDLDAWQPPPPPAGLADAVIARMRQPAAASAVEPSEHRSRRFGWIAGVALAAAAAAALATWGMSRSPGHGHGDVMAARPQHLDLDGSTADLDAGAEVRWQRDGGRITAQQTRGNVQWTIQEGDTLVLAPGGPGATATIEASGASLRVEARMNLSDMRVLGASSLTAAAVALVSVTVYTGHVRATSGGQTVRLEPGAAVELRPAALPVPKQAPDPSLVGASPVDVAALEARLAAAETRIRDLTAELAVKDREAATAPEPRNVPPSELEAHRVQGERAIEPDAATRIELALAGTSKVISTFKLCVDASGRVSSVKPLKSTGLDRYDRAIVEAMHGWRFDPVEIDGEAGPVCSAVTFRYELPTAAPPPQ